MENNKTFNTTNGAVETANNNDPVNVLADGVPANQEPTPVNGFDREGEDQFTGMTREELLAALNKTGVGTETVTGTVVEDAITGEKLPGNTQDLVDINSLQDLQPENIKRHLAGIIKQSLTTLIPEDLTEEDADAIITSLEDKIANIDKKDIKSMDAMQVKNIYGTDVFNQIKRFNPTNYSQVAKKLLVDFKDGIVEYQGVVDSMEEINRHMKFFQDINVDAVQADIKKQIEEDTVTYPTEFHKYKKYLELYLEYLDGRADYQGNPFMDKEKEITNEKIAAISEALQFNQIYSKVENGKQKLLKDFQNTPVLNKTIFDFIGKLHNDSSLNVSFPMPKNFSAKTNIAEVLTSVWVSFLEMSIIRGQFPAVKSLTSAEYVEMTQLLRGQIKEQSKKVDEVVEVDKIDLKAFITDNGITVGEIVEARKAAIAISYIIARTFKPTVINSSQYMKYVLSYTMNILTQSMYNDGCNQLLLSLVDGIRNRLA
jgi:hypothetical protein